MKTCWVVTRQHYYYSQQHIVEIAYGGLDYSGADALCRSYPGEFEEFENPVEAIDTAIKIAETWKADEAKKPKEKRVKIFIAHGCTGGMGMEFEGELANKRTYAILRKWARERLEKFPKCDQCGEPIFGTPISYNEFSEFQFDREYCAEKWLEENYAEEEVS